MKPHLSLGDSNHEVALCAPPPLSTSLFLSHSPLDVSKVRLAAALAALEELGQRYHLREVHRGAEALGKTVLELDVAQCFELFSEV